MSQEYFLNTNSSRLEITLYLLSPLALGDKRGGGGRVPQAFCIFFTLLFKVGVAYVIKMIFSSTNL